LGRAHQPPIFYLPLDNLRVEIDQKLTDRDQMTV
jgi:hypothetical protein